MAFDYSQSGLPKNEKWEKATEICSYWLNQHMSKFSEEERNRFMMHQPVSAAKLIMNNSKEWSDESVIVALLGPAKIILERSAEWGDYFGQKSVDLLKYMHDDAPQHDPVKARDTVRLFLVEGLSAMNDQMIGRARIDAHHQVRWSMLKGFEEQFAEVKGQNPAIDAIFEKAMVESRKTLQGLDDAAKVKKMPKPPAM